MDNNKLIEKTRKQLSKLGYSEEKINEFLKDLETDDEEQVQEKQDESVENQKVEEPKQEEKPLTQNEQVKDSVLNEVVDAEGKTQDVSPAVDYESKYNELKKYIDTALKGINEKFEGLSSKTDKSYEMLSAMGVDEEPKQDEVKEDRIAKMFGGLASEDFVEEQPQGDRISNLFEGKK